MYILIKEQLDTGLAIVTAAHASLAAYLRFKDTSEVATWLSGPFYKTVCKVNDAEFEKAKEAKDFVALVESRIANQGEIALAFKPREEYPKSFKFFRLYKD